MLNKLDTHVDPLIPYKPVLDEIFSVQNLQVDTYLFPIEAFSANFKTMLRHQNPTISDDLSLQTVVKNQVDSESIQKFFSQIQNIEMKKMAIDLFLLNCLAEKSSVKIISVFGTVNSMLLEVFIY